MTGGAAPTATIAGPGPRLADRSAARHAVVGAAVVAAVAVATTSDSDDGVVLCPFRRCTGGYCPGCGGTRAAGRLLRGDVVGAWHRHPFVVLLVAQVMVLGALAGSAERRRRLRALWVPLVTVDTVVLVVLWIVRLGLGDVPGPF